MSGPRLGILVSIRRIFYRILNLDSTSGKYALIIGVAIVAILLHSLNLYYYPAWFFDEGAYLTFGLEWIRSGQLTYYGHPFALLGFLSLLFGTVNPTNYLLPRTTMVVLSGLDTGFVYVIASRLYQRGRLLPVFSALIYATTPLSVRYLRLVVVDNFMTFFLLLSIVLILVRPNNFVYASLCFGLALISKQTAFFFLPPMLYLVYKQGRRSLTYYLEWLILAAVPAIIWIVYGILEVGLSNLIMQQFALTSLGGERAVGALNLIIQRITSRDPFIFVGIVGVAWAVYRKYVMVFFPIVYLLSFVVLFLKISTVYLIPVLPFFSILAALLVLDIMKYFPSLFSVRNFRILSVACLIILLSIVSLGLVLSQNPATPQEQALHYVGSLGSVKVVVSYTYLWLIQQNYPRITAYDRYNVASWSRLGNSTRLYLIIDYPGDLVTIQSIPQLNTLYSSSPKINFTDADHTYLVQVVNSTLDSIVGR